jgi:hypothetical protein
VHGEPRIEESATPSVESPAVEAVRDALGGSRADGLDEVREAEALQALYSERGSAAFIGLRTQPVEGGVELIEAVVPPELPANAAGEAEDSSGPNDSDANLGGAAPSDPRAAAAEAARAEADDVAGDTLAAAAALLGTEPRPAEPMPSRPSVPSWDSAPRQALTPPAPRLDSPLPSFDIPDPASRRGVDARVRTGPRPVVPLAPLSEIGEEDDDDAVTHIGLPVVEASHLDHSGDLEGFQVADPGVAALQAFDPELNINDARRATTRVIARVDLEQQQAKAARQAAPTAKLSAVHEPAAANPVAKVGRWFSTAFSRREAELSELPLGSGEVAPTPRHLSWWVDNVLPALSLVLLGSGIGAWIANAQGAQQAQSVQALKDAAPKRPLTLIERAEAGEGDALFKITNMPAAERTSALTLALESGYRTQRLAEYEEFNKGLQVATAQPAQLSRFVDYAASPETMLPALRDLAGWAGSRGPDVLYAVWEKAPGGSRAASLAQQLLQAADQRAKATPALAAALDLRVATSCEDYLKLLPVVFRDGDQRSSATLRALKHTDGCGDDGQQDCYACLREGKLLDETLSAIEGRAAPQL